MEKFDSIGKTPLLPLHTLAGEPLKATVLIKDESKNPTGTHKDRKSALLIRQALEKNIDTLAIITSGNAGYSLARLAQGTSLRIVTIVSQTIRTSIKENLYGAGADVVSVDLSKPLTEEKIISLARQSSTEKIWNVTNAGHEAYKTIYEEIAQEHPAMFIRDNATMIIAPLGSGELYLGLDEAMEERKSKAVLLGVHPISSDSKADKLSAHHLPLQNAILNTQLDDHCSSGLRADAVEFRRKTFSGASIMHPPVCARNRRHWCR